MVRSFFLCFTLAGPLAAAEPEFRLPKNFVATRWADESLAKDIRALAFDDRGRVVVSGPGYVRRLADTNGDGRADKAVEIAVTKTGASSLLFAFDSEHPETFDLYTAMDGKILGHNGSRAKPVYPVYQERLKSFADGHALRVGPDGKLYASLGYNGRLDALKLAKESPVRKPQAGGIIRFPNWVSEDVEVVDHGLRNPRDFEFTPLGDLIALDDGDESAGLPWHVPARLVLVRPGSHHGCVVSGARVLTVRDDPDSIPPIVEFGDGAPTGLCCYRHTQFPPHYRGGVFVTDPKLGRVSYVPLAIEGSGYRAVAPEVFVEATDASKFAPVAARVAPDGSLFVAARDGVYRIECRAGGLHPAMPRSQPDDPIDLVLDAPQPNEAGSEYEGIQLTREIAKADLRDIALKEEELDHRRIRAMEIIDRRKSNPLFWPLYSKSNAVQTRAASMVELLPTLSFDSTFWSLLQVSNSRMRLALYSRLQGQQLEQAWVDSPRLDQAEIKQQRIAVMEALIDDDDAQVRYTVGRFARSISAFKWPRYWDRIALSNDVRRMLVLSVTESRYRQASSAVESRSPITLPYRAFLAAETDRDRADAIRAVMLACGGYNLAMPIEMFATYALKERRRTVPFERLEMDLFTQAVRDQFPGRDATFNREAARWLAMVEDDHPAIVEKVLGRLAATTDAVDTFHYLAVLARLPANFDSSQKRRVADALARLESRTAPGRDWPIRVSELAAELKKRLEKE